MATTSTPRYQLVKPTPATAEPVSVANHLNGNWDKIDQDLNRFTITYYTSTTVWNKPTRHKASWVYVKGGGGSGGGCAATSGNGAAGGGGGEGGYSWKYFDTSALAASETVTVGAGGAASAAGGAGNAGGTSSFATGKGYVVTANGGGAGAAGATSGGNTQTAPGVGGTSSGGDINLQGGNGGIGSLIGGAVVPGCFGAGSQISSNASPPTASGSGNTGHNYGGGSSGAINYPGTESSRASTAGAPGIVIVIDYF